MQELTMDQIDQVSGGVAPLVFVGLLRLTTTVGSAMGIAAFAFSQLD